METQHTIPVAAKLSRPRIWLGVILLGVGLLGHILAAQVIGRAIDYQHHVFGFFLILIVTGPIIAGLAWLFWRGRHDITLLIVGAVQALLGLVIYLGQINA